MEDRRCSSFLYFITILCHLESSKEPEDADGVSSVEPLQISSTSSLLAIFAILAVTSSSQLWEL